MTDLHLDLPDSSYRSIVFLKLIILFAHSFFTISANMKLSLTRTYSNSWKISNTGRDGSCCSKILMPGSRVDAGCFETLSSVGRDCFIPGLVN